MTGLTIHLHDPLLSLRLRYERFIMLINMKPQELGKIHNIELVEVFVYIMWTIYTHQRHG